MILSNHYLKMTDAIVPGEIFSCFSPTRASMERFAKCPLEKTESLHFNRDTVLGDSVPERQGMLSGLLSAANSDCIRPTSML